MKMNSDNNENSSWVEYKLEYLAGQNAFKIIAFSTWFKEQDLYTL